MNVANASRNINSINQLRFIGKLMDAAMKSVGDIQFLSYGHSTNTVQGDDELEFNKLMLESNIKTIYTSLVILMESMCLNVLLEEFQKEFAQYAKDLSAVEIIPYIGDMESPVVRMYLRYMSSLMAYFGENSPVPFEPAHILERILSGTAKLVLDKGIKPANEAEVRKCIYDYLIHVFPDTVREVPIAQVTKTYKPDIGIPSLKAAIEYKFATSPGEVKTAIGGLYEDMRGYSGSEDWKTFYAVVYMSDAYFTDAQIKAEFKHTGVDDNWKPILIVGGAARTRTVRRVGATKKAISR